MKFEKYREKLLSLKKPTLAQLNEIIERAADDSELTNSEYTLIYSTALEMAKRWIRPRRDKKRQLQF